MEDQTAKQSRKRLLLGATLVIAVGALGVITGLLLARETRSAAAEIPRHIAEQVLFPAYALTPLPDGYRVIADSYAVQEKAITFRIASADGKIITVSEQIRPAKFDFDSFYQQQLSQPKNLQQVPYPSVLGTVEGNTRLLSIAADKTWIMVTTKTAPDADMRFIANHVTRQ